MLSGEALKGEEEEVGVVCGRLGAICPRAPPSSHRSISSKMIGGRYLRAEIVRKKGRILVSDPICNKGLGFPISERDRLGIRGLVPPTM